MAPEWVTGACPTSYSERPPTARRAVSDPEPPSHARSPRTVWSRPVDHDRQRVRMRRLLGFYVLPCAAIAVGLAVVLSPGEALGFVILAGVLGLLLGGWVLFQNLNERANARIVLNDGTLVFGQKAVPVAEVESFTTVHTSTLGPDPRPAWETPIWARSCSGSRAVGRSGSAGPR
jgi:hypothetical protein